MTDLLHITPRHDVTRRDLLKLLAGGIAALELGCLERPGDQEIVPYLADPREQRPGTPTYYTGALALDGFGTGVIVETHDGRPTKLDGNPAHPASLGGSLPWLQARILDLYDPQRAREVRWRGEFATWADVVTRLGALPRGTPLWLVMPPTSSPTIAWLLGRLRRFHDVHVVFDAPIDHRAAYRGHALAYGGPLELQLALSRADVIVALDADFLAAMPMAAAWARAAAARRAPTRAMSRLWTAAPVPTATTTLSDEHLAIPAGMLAALAACIAREVGVALPAALADRARGVVGESDAWARRVAADLAAHRGAGAIVVGDRQPPIVHALARWIDHACGNVGPADGGRPVALTEPAIVEPLGGETLAAFAAALHDGATAIAIDVDPVYTAPRALGLREALRAAPLAICVAAYETATARACVSRVPLAHELETWSDPRAWDGTLAIGQPAIRPRFEVASTIDVLAALLRDPRDARALVRDTFTELIAPGRTVDEATPEWTAALRAGVVAGTAAPLVAREPLAWPPVASDALARALDAIPAGTIEVALAPSRVHDGRFAANAWLQELPHAITKQTWGNAALMSRATADRLGVHDEDLLDLATPAGDTLAPVIVVDGAAADSITLELGYGQRAPRVPIANRIGSDAYALRGGAELIVRATATRAGGHARLARTQHFTSEHGHELAPIATLARFLDEPGALTRSLRGDQPSLLPPRSRAGVQWGMSIDTSICTGCSACMVACQAENNIPSVGPDDVARGRHMNWIRVDRYIHDGGAVINEPVPCQMCEDAPCEYVCPVMATTHSPDGLNEQVYNRCVGTRFCSNNCPYKVRRFNWFAYEHRDERALQYNPDVTVRSRGVMEKCTYCVQRIRGAEHRALVEKRPIRAGEVVTACQAACPTGAIQFGQLAERGTPFAALRGDPRRFDLLHELGTRPRTQYLAKITNPKERG